MIRLTDPWPADAADACFADEAAIDFPSVVELAARARDRFLGQRRGGETITAELHLSRHDASSGTVVPVDVPVRGLCTCCGGRGEVWADPCVECAGSGDRTVRYPFRVTVPRGVSDGARFRVHITPPHAEPLRVEFRVAIRSSAA